MFERYTEKARRVIFFARYEAIQCGSPEIDLEHILLGLIREDRSLLRWIPNANAETIRRRVEEHLPKAPPMSTAIDLPLSDVARRALKHAASEADRLARKHIGTEHLLLGMLDEEKSFIATLLRENGTDADKLRMHYAEHGSPPRPWTFQRASYLDHGFRTLSMETVEIHGSRWNVDYVRDAINLLRAYNWHWHKAGWKPRDVVIYRKDGTCSFDLSLANQSDNFSLVKGGWKKDHCFVCRWELFESEDDHGAGYTNGQDWLCMECYERFWQRPGFFSSSYSEIT